MSYPHLTVATLVEKNDKFLLVLEESDEGPVINQPAGHVELNETIIEAATRETLEETGYKVTPTALLGIHQYTAPANGITYIRNSFIADVDAKIEEAKLDDGIIEALWLSYEEIKNKKPLLRSPMVLHDIERYLATKDKQNPAALYSLDIYRSVS